MRPLILFILLTGLLLLAACAANSTAEPAVPLETSPEALSPSAAEAEPMTTDIEATAVATPATEPTVVGVMSDLPDLGAAPEITNDVWVNADTPVTLASQRGKVVLVEFWTFGCINCKHVIPYVRDWYDKYAGDDFNVISVHYPEFSYEREYDNVVKATQDLEVRYPVAIDNDRVTWSAYHQHYWPTTYLIDKNGRIRYQHIGEGAYAQTEAAIVALMAEPEPTE